MTTSEKVAHLKGVIEGMEYDTTSKEGKIISLMVDILDDISAELIEVEDDIDTLFDFGDELDEDLGAVEEDLYGDGCDGYCCDCDSDECDSSEENACEDCESDDGSSQ